MTKRTYGTTANPPHSKALFKTEFILGFVALVFMGVFAYAVINWGIPHWGMPDLN